MDILDTRDLNKRLNELEDEREDLEDAVTILEDEAKDCEADYSKVDYQGTTYLFRS